MYIHIRKRMRRHMCAHIHIHIHLHLHLHIYIHIPTMMFRSRGIFQVVPEPWMRKARDLKLRGEAGMKDCALPPLLLHCYSIVSYSRL